jgi:hypothetical protein
MMLKVNWGQAVWGLSPLREAVRVPRLFRMLLITCHLLVVLSLVGVRPADGAQHLVKY